MEPKDHQSVTVEEQQYHYAEAEESVEESEDSLKKKISCHALYGLLVQTHLDCLKVCLGGVGKGDDDDGVAGHSSEDHQEAAEKYYMPGSSCMVKKTELDYFMESYCMVLRKLKDAMEKQQLESVAFINNMHSQLKQLLHDNPQSTSASTSPPGENIEE